MNVIPPKLPDSENGTLSPIPHDRQTSSEVLTVTVGENDSLTASIKSGAPFFKVLEVAAYNLVRETVDPSELPPGHHGPVFYWTEEKVRSSDGVTPLAVTKGERIHLTVSAEVALHALRPGPFSGAVALRGATLSRTVAVQGTYLAVDEQSPIGRKWMQMGGEARLGEVRTNAHPAPDGQGTIQEFANGALYEVPGVGVFYLSAGVYAKWVSPAVADAKTATGQIVQQFLGFPTEDTFATPEGGEALRFKNGVIVVRADRSACFPTGPKLNGPPKRWAARFASPFAKFPEIAASQVRRRTVSLISA